ncbi:MAG: DNA polymerase I [Patescibacteria group bacterium]|nr:DNA polymerase I [Patescibacteria group bacterium]MDD4610655.1 DNA polymerase I [Patescibacteria group bacterium]
MADSKEKLIIIDGNAIIHRSFHALPPTMRTKSGETTNAVYGFVMVLFKALKEFKPDYVVLTLDKKGPTFRHLEYKDYKATRVKAPDELYSQIPRVREIAEALGIPVFEKEGFEADDLIGTVSRKVESRKLKVESIIVTGDLDTLQLVDEHTKVYTMSRGLSDSVIYDEKMVRERFNGLGPDQMIDYKGLRGDPSDNIPGVKGIGEKTAIELLKEFGSLEKIYKAVNSKQQTVNSKIKPRILELLRLNEKNAFLSKKLATINRESPIEFDLTKAKFGNIDQARLVQLLSELEFKSLLPRVRELTQGNPGTSLREDRDADSHVSKFERNKKIFKYILVDDEKKFEKFLRELKKQKEFTFDTETTGFDPLSADLLGISFSWKEGEAYFIKTLKHENIKTNLDLFSYQNKQEENKPYLLFANYYLQSLQPIFEDEKIKKCGHNVKFDMQVLASQGVKVQGVDFDTMIASYLLNPGTRQHNLDALTFSELGFEKISKDDLLGTGKNKITFGEVPTEKLALYSCEDADFTQRLKIKLEKELTKEKLKKVFADIEMPLALVLADMETNGIKLNTKVLGSLAEKVDKKIKALEKKIWHEAGVKFNINSTQQLKEILFEKLEISTLGISKIKTGFSTSADELEKLKHEHEIIPLIQEYRELNKLFNTYIDSLPELVNKKTGRLHTSFNQTVTSTGRLSSTEPNLQNIPVRTELGREIRNAFVTEKGFKLLSLDYSQIELRLAAHLSGDKKMIAVFDQGLDIHTATAAEINGVKLEEVTKQMRREAKAINFGILYGQGPYGLSQAADISMERAREFIENYFKIYQGVKKYIDESIELARERGYTETLFGRKRYLPEINSSVVQLRKAAERMAINAPLQGTCADIIKVAMIRIDEMINGLKDDGKNIKMLLQVHDELLFEIKEDMISEMEKKIKKIMENVIKLKVQIIADAKVGDNWGEMREF